MVIDTKKSVGEIAAEVPGAVKVFETWGIDYCCGGSQPFDQACREAGAPIRAIQNTLEAGVIPSQENGAASMDWNGRPYAEIIKYILDQHHAYTRRQGDRLKVLAEKVEVAHGKNHPELKEIKSMITEMVDELDGHMTKEEDVIFPAIIEAELKLAGQRGPWANPHSLVHPLKILRWEHAVTGDEFQKLHKVTLGFSVPSDGCVSYRELFDGLKELEADLHRHVHLENNILFKKVEEAGILD